MHWCVTTASSGRGAAGRLRFHLAASVAVALALPWLSGCAREPQLLRAPVSLHSAVSVIPLHSPLEGFGPACDLRFEFARPGDSRRADALHVALVTENGTRDTLVDVRLDRRGENTVSLIGRLGRAAGARQQAYHAIALSSDVPVRVTGLRGTTIR